MKKNNVGKWLSSAFQVALLVLFSMNHASAQEPASLPASLPVSLPTSQTTKPNAKQTSLQQAQQWRLQLKHKEASKRKEACLKISQQREIKDPVIKEMGNLLLDSDIQVRKVAIRVLGSFDGGIILNLQGFSKALIDREKEVRTLTRKTLTKAGFLNKRKAIWLTSNLEKAMDKAKGLEPIIVKISADWCSPCNQLSAEVLETPAGKSFLKEAVGLIVDFEKPAGRIFTTKYRVLGLPTTLILSPNGKELGRIEGYSGRKAYIEELRSKLTEGSNISQLAAMMQKSPKSLKAKYQYARALLISGKILQASSILQKLFKAKPSISIRAYHTWGRYLLRVKRTPNAAHRHFEKAMKKYKNTKSYGGFLYWCAKAHREAGFRAKALSLFDNWLLSGEKKAKVYSYKASFMNHYRYDAKKTKNVLLLLLQEKLKNKKPVGAWTHYLLAQTHLRLEKPKKALKEINIAIKRSPKIAIFKNFLKRVQKEIPAEPR